MFTCPRCGTTSDDPDVEAHNYCPTCHDTFTLGRWYDRDHRPIGMAAAGRLLTDPDARRVAHDEFAGGWVVETQFLVMDHRLEPGGPPVLYETLLDGPDTGPMVWRYTTEAEAVAGHDQVAARVRDGRASDLLVDGGPDGGRGGRSDDR